MSKIIYRTNKEASYDDFKDLIEATVESLNQKVKENEEEYVGANYLKIEKIVYEELKRCAKGTPFEGTIEYKSGQLFPDIVVGKFYGVEVKSTKKNQWNSFGNSIFEGTRVKDVEKIFLVFGKMASPVEFRFRSYEECISNVVVDHSPRYHVDMEIQGKGEKTLFEDLDISYEDFRNKSNIEQVELISQKKKEALKEGESLWWSIDSEDQPRDDKLKVFSTLNAREKEQIIAKAFGLFPELFGSSSHKYSRFLLWLVTDMNIVTGNTRDAFSAGGQVDFELKDGHVIKAPAVIGNLNRYKDIIVTTINETPETKLKEFWKVDNIEENRVSQWIKICTSELKKFRGFEGKYAKQVFATIFVEYI